MREGLGSDAGFSDKASRLVFLDTETTGLDPETEEIFELAVIEQDGTEHLWTFEPPGWMVASMHPKALAVNRYHERTSHPEWEWSVPFKPYELDSQPNLDETLAEVREFLEGAHIVGAVPDFDARFIAELYRSSNVGCPRWHYHLIDIESVAIGYLAAKGTSLELPWNSEDLSRQIGVNPPQGEARHTALADARWVGAMWTSMGLNQEETA